MHKWFVSDEFDEASKAAADFLAGHIEACIQQKGVCHVALPGGNTPAHCLSYLAGKKLSWEQINWYLGDERCFPSGHAERNDVMLEKNLWSQISAPHIQRISAELGAEQAAQQYREIVNSIDYFDIIFLGMGEDGHTASLFPGNEALHDTRSVIPVYNSPKEPADRVSLSISTIKKAKCRMVLTGGAAKSDVIRRVKKGESLPINCLGDINWFVDKAALTESV